jgi:hypothetical protein
MLTIEAERLKMEPGKLGGQRLQIFITLMRSRIRILIKMKYWIRIRIRIAVKSWIRNPERNSVVKCC